MPHNDLRAADLAAPPPKGFGGGFRLARKMMENRPQIAGRAEPSIRIVGAATPISINGVATTIRRAINGRAPNNRYGPPGLPPLSGR